MREQMVELRGMRFCLCRWGPDQGAPVLILHGWLDQGASWDATGRALAESLGRPVVAFEHRGHGRSDPAPPGSTYHFTEYIADVDALLRELGWSGVALVGHSMGGTIACQLAALRPERVARLVLVEGLGPPPVSDEDAVDQLRQHLDQIARPPERTRLASAADAASRLQRINAELSDVEALRLAERVLVPHPDGEGSTWRWDPMHRSRAAVAFDIRRFRLLLARIQAPTDLLFGARSWYARIEDLEDRVQRIPRVASRQTLESGHSPHMEVPQRLAEVLAGVLRPQP